MLWTTYVTPEMESGFQKFLRVVHVRQLKDHLRQQAAHDPLTGLANYRQLAEVLDTEIKRSERTGREFAVLLFGLDG